MQKVLIKTMQECVTMLAQSNQHFTYLYGHWSKDGPIAIRAYKSSLQACVRIAMDQQRYIVVHANPATFLWIVTPFLNGAPISVEEYLNTANTTKTATIEDEETDEGL